MAVIDFPGAPVEEPKPVPNEGANVEPLALARIKHPRARENARKVYRVIRAHSGEELSHARIFAESGVRPRTARSAIARLLQEKLIGRIRLCQGEGLDRRFTGFMYYATEVATRGSCAVPETHSEVATREEQRASEPPKSGHPYMLASTCSSNANGVSVTTSSSRTPKGSDEEDTSLPSTNGSDMEGGQEELSSFAVPKSRAEHLAELRALYRERNGVEAPEHLDDTQLLIRARHGEPSW